MRCTLDSLAQARCSSPMMASPIITTSGSSIFMAMMRMAMAMKNDDEAKHDKADYDAEVGEEGKEDDGDGERAEDD